MPLACVAWHLFRRPRSCRRLRKSKMPQKLVFRPITKSMTPKQAEQEYLNLLKLSMHDDGTYNPDGDIDAVIIADMLQGKSPPTKAEVLERWRQSDLRY